MSHSSVATGSPWLKLLRARPLDELYVLPVIVPDSGTQSFFGWLDYDERDAQLMHQVCAAFDEKDTVDSLGLGVIRDSISDQLFPGITTIQTRARYFLFVPWICGILESEGTSPVQFNKRIGELEVELIESLRHIGPNHGVIGYVARGNLIRLPSTVYWNGLYEFRIRLLRLTIPQYRGTLRHLVTSRATIERDDDGGLLTAFRTMWDPDLPAPPPGFPDQPMSVTLTRDESEYLAGKIISNQPDTLISELARDLSIDRTVPLPWEVHLRGLAPSSRLAQLLQHGRNFSELMQGAQALYNLLLARRARERLDWDTAALEEDLLGELDDWISLVTSRGPALREWLSGEDFWATIERATRVPNPTRQFVQNWAKVALPDPASIVDGEDAERLITGREFRLKGKLARLTELRALENWTGAAFSGGQMSFRWANAKQILDDLEYHEAD